MVELIHEKVKVRCRLADTANSWLAKGLPMASGGSRSLVFVAHRKGADAFITDYAFFTRNLDWRTDANNTKNKARWSRGVEAT